MKTQITHTTGTAYKDGLTGWLWIKNPYGKGDMHLADIRGWGHLTGGGACNFPDEKAAAIQDENQNRLIACWNACAGYSTEALEGAGEGYFHKAIKEMIDAIKLKDAALEACEPAVRAYTEK